MVSQPENLDIYPDTNMVHCIGWYPYK